MKFKIIHLYLVIVILSILTCFTTCKKYPENTLWFRNPKKLSPVHGYIKSYTVNGIDSLGFLNAYYEPTIKHGYGPYNKAIKDVKQEYFDVRSIKKGDANINCDLFSGYIGVITKWSSNKKSINIRSGVDLDYYKRNIFIVSGLNWDIIYLDKNMKAKIKTIYNGNTYEITFDF